MKRLLAMTMFVFSSVSVFGDEAKNLLKPINQVESWRLEQHEGAEGTLKIAEGAVVINAVKLSGTNWHIQAFQHDLDLQEGKEYTLKLKLTASKRRSVLLVATTDSGDYHDIGLHEDLSVDTDVRTLDFTFRASSVETKKNRIGFVLGDEKGDIIIKEMTLTEKAAKK